MSRIQGGNFRFCLNKLPIVLHDKVKVYTKFTEDRENSGSNPFILVTEELSPFTTGSSDVCYDIPIAEIEVPYAQVKVQVAVAVNRHMSSYVPDLRDAQTLGECPQS